MYVTYDEALQRKPIHRPLLARLKVEVKVEVKDEQGMIVCMFVYVCELYTDFIGRRA